MMLACGFRRVVANFKAKPPGEDASTIVPVQNAVHNVFNGHGNRAR